MEFEHCVASINENGESPRTSDSNCYAPRMRRSIFVLIALVILACGAPSLPAGDWSQWAGSDTKNMISQEKGLYDSFVPGEKKPDGTIDLGTARDVRWGVEVATAIYSTASFPQG